MRACIIRRIIYRALPTDRPTWGYILAERGGLALIFVPGPDDKHAPSITIGAENVDERVFEDVPVSRFLLHGGDLAAIGRKLSALADEMDGDEMEQFFRNAGLE